MRTMRLRPLLERIKAECGALANLSGSTIQLDALPRDLELQLLNIPANDLKRVLVNLVANGLNYSPIGSTVQLRASVPTKQPHNHGKPQPMMVEFAVVDSGVAISSKEKKTVFEAYARGVRDQLRTQQDSSETGAATVGGTGLGLSIASKLVHNMHGDIKVETGKTRGNTFSFVIALDPRGTIDLSNTEHSTMSPPWRPPMAESMVSTVQTESKSRNVSVVFSASHQMSQKPRRVSSSSLASPRLAKDALGSPPKRPLERQSLEGQSPLQLRSGLSLASRGVSLGLSASPRQKGVQAFSLEPQSTHSPRLDNSSEACFSSEPRERLPTFTRASSSVQDLLLPPPMQKSRSSPSMHLMRGRVPSFGSAECSDDEEGTVSDDPRSSKDLIAPLPLIRIISGEPAVGLPSDHLQTLEVAEHEQAGGQRPGTARSRKKKTRRHAKVPSPRAREAVPNTLHILVVEDNKLNQSLLCR
jgi:hypothetical protein